ncbi:transcriptional repressor, LexA family [Thioalkalivibrio sp. K90mix]|uniref:transcriptional repressor LexA n=1 Tax=unclassified Thioalkalivibrio TaxID=2621013 RepID=UPI000195A484|nr:MULTISPECIES: transcriptional repressor LexA [unclassified Thioalkalivibrio]ADC72323.1 transcriptional repressor, LexA family [Thioalkalivibrio sp. K90mix]
MSLTARQQAILDYISETVATQGTAPTRSEIARAFGFRSPYAAECHLKALEKKGAIELVGGAARGIRLAGARAARPAELPLVGRVAAGSPILATEHIERHYRIDDGLFRARPDYLLRVHGESMRDAGILDGDLLAVRQTPEAHPGQIVVARIEDEVTVKRYEQDGARVRLLPENPDFAPIEIDLERQALAIEGIGVGVLRDLESRARH